MEWQSKRLHRAVQSTLSAECLAAVEAANASYLACKIISELLKCERIPVTIWTDSKSLIDNVHSTKTVSNKRLLIDVACLRNKISLEELNELRWIPTSFQLANALTKEGCSSLYLLETLKGTLRYSHETGMFT